MQLCTNSTSAVSSWQQKTPDFNNNDYTFHTISFQTSRPLDSTKRASLWLMPIYPILLCQTPFENSADNITETIPDWNTADSEVLHKLPASLFSYYICKKQCTLTAEPALLRFQNTLENEIPRVSYVIRFQIDRVCCRFTYTCNRKLKFD